MSAPRIVSLLPSCTEIVWALGMGDHLVGRSHECDFPTAVRVLPACTAPNLDTRAPGEQIDREVKTRLQEALSVFRIDTAKLAELRPDVILTQSQCEVCAVSLPELEEALHEWIGLRPRLVSVAPSSLGDVWDDILRLSEALGVSRCGLELVARLKARVDTIAAGTRPISRRPSVACLEWLGPLMAAGNWVPELVQLAGGRSLFGEPGKHSPWLDWSAVVSQDPEIIVVMPCGFDLARTRAEMPALVRTAGWQTLRAVQRRQVYLADGNQYFNRPGPRLVESLEILAEIVHPDIFRFGHEGGGWEKW